MGRNKNATPLYDPKIKFADEEGLAETAREEAESQDVAEVSSPAPRPVVGGQLFSEMTPAEARKANMLSAKKAIESVRHLDVAKSFAAKKPEVPYATAEEARELRARRFRVLEDRALSRNGGTFVLKAGKEISENGYDITGLKRAGVKLEEITDE